MTDTTAQMLHAQQKELLSLTERLGSLERRIIRLKNRLVLTILVTALFSVIIALVAVHWLWRLVLP